MKKKIIISAILSLLAMVVIPLAIVFLTSGLDALGILLIFVFTLNPIVSIIIGVLSGGKKVLWYLPIANAAVFLATLVIITGFDISYVVMSAVYAGLGIAAAYITKAIKK